MTQLTTKIKSLSSEPGVYLMKGQGGEILYVGKAKNLKNRVSSYFIDSMHKSPRTQLLVQKIADLEVVITDNEVEALLLEFNLIKKYKPKYNVRLKDDKSYPYVRVDVKHPFPRLEYVRKVRKDGAKYFGPYISAYQIKDLLRWAQAAFQLRDCSDAEFRNRSRPCILYQMKRCSAPCVGFIEQDEYNKNIEMVLKILDGQTQAVIKELTKQMKRASAAQDFEHAATLRDRIESIKELNQDQKVTAADKDHNRDYIHYAREALRPNEEGMGGGRAVVVVMSVRNGRTVGVFQFPFENLDPDLTDDQFLLDFLVQYYLSRYESSADLIAPDVFLPTISKDLEKEQDYFREQLQILSSALGKTVDFHLPKRGDAVHMLAMIKKTADFHLSELTSKAIHTAEDLIDVQKRLSLRKFPHRIECYDISHFQGEGTVASRTVFMDGKPEKALYRHYHVQTAQGPDDFRSLREILERRFLHDTSQPDLVVIDGGKGQLAQAIAIFQEIGVTGVELVSIAKARTESDFSKTEIQGTMERIFKPNQKNPIVLKPGTGAHRVLTQIRDESHRFAISFHRKVRDKRILKSKR